MMPAAAGQLTSAKDTTLATVNYALWANLAG
jgi:hypothetical protein